jgi:hypothetical protein
MDGGRELGVAAVTAPVIAVIASPHTASRRANANRLASRLVSLTKARAVGKIEKPRNTVRMRFSPRHPADSVPEWRNWQTR